MKVLIFGGGARENAIAWKISQSPLLTKLFLASPNDGFKDLGEEIGFIDYNDLVSKSKEFGIDFLIVGPEVPLVDGIVDIFNQNGIKAIGPTKEWARLEGSKAYAKDFMIRNSIPTANSRTITKNSDIEKNINEVGFPLVIKADGLAAGKGVTFAHNMIEAKTIIEDYLNGQFGDASKTIVLEEYLVGRELSLITLWDGLSLLPFIPARDYKKLLDNDLGPNTGGMGSYCPVELDVTQLKQIDDYIEKLSFALATEKADFTGVIYSGLILTKDGIKVLEYNMRFGDPETQPLLMHMESDLLEIFRKAADRKLNNTKITWKEGKSYCVVVAAKGYPEQPVKRGSIENISEVKKNCDVEVFYAGVKKEDNTLLANGGRVLSVCKSGKEPQDNIYRAINELKYSDKVYRMDIGS